MSNSFIPTIQYSIDGSNLTVTFESERVMQLPLDLLATPHDVDTIDGWVDANHYFENTHAKIWALVFVREIEGVTIRLYLGGWYSFVTNTPTKIELVSAVVRNGQSESLKSLLEITF